ncbi:spore coat protein [Heyndrickxia camelliae]|uniref:Spore coat protein n=1 Tax=Heyndrickxia camelliae TaxID=1707093 RepID=A0A2N3LCV1_9BACI|nr:spore coat protein [Heyndrickxia camelliae]PKR82482.1 spore coat protein [Heyndrickxia camelliae]
MQNQQGQIHQNMHTGNIPQQMNHGGHEVLDVSEVLTGAIGVMDQYTMLRQHVQDQELMDILDRQLQFMQQEYNTTVECFKTGQDPAVPTQSYKMNQNNDFIYGLTPSQPKKPVQSPTELTDACVSSMMLGAVKSTATMKTMAALETTNPVVRRVLADSIPNCIEMAYEISLYQNKHHYYQVPQFASQDMQQMLNGYAPVNGQQQMQMQNNMTH